jgi:phosphate starvation-inducible protein PhoH and related proteins
LLQLTTSEAAPKPGSESRMFEATIPLVEAQLALPLFGARDQNLQKIRHAFGVNITHRDGRIRVAGEAEAVAQATSALEELKSLAESKGVVSDDDVNNVLSLFSIENIAATPPPIDVINVSRRVEPRTPGQAQYVDTIRTRELTFAVGPAGTGKTYMAVALAVEALKNQQVRKIVLCRPAVEAGESLGFLPGDLQAKINPYLRPLLDALHEMIDFDQIKRFMEQDVIEVVPLAYMRGRTLNEAFIILDEAQNASISQMKMFLTRLGVDSKIVVSGDVTQTDLPRHQGSGLMDAIQRLKGIPGIGTVHLTEKDIVRHRLVQEIVRAYDDMPPKANRKRNRS